MDESVLFAGGQASMVPTEYGPMERWWMWMTSNFTEFQLVVPISLCFLVLVYFFASLPFFLLDWLQPAWAMKYKIQKDRIVDMATTWKCVKKLIFNHAFIAAPLMVLAYPTLQWRGVSVAMPLPSWSEMLLRVVFYFLLEDCWFYFAHKWLHTEWAYKNIHYMHHEFDHPIGMASSYAHPLEFVILGVGTFMGPVIVGGGHLVGIWVWMIFRQVEAIHCHTGYAFPINFEFLFPLYCGPTHHDFHHLRCAGNYSSVFVIWDRIFGTDEKYHEWVAAGGSAMDEARRATKGGKVDSVAAMNGNH